MNTVNDCNFKHFFFYLFQEVNMNSLAKMSNPMERGGGRSVEQPKERKQLWNK